MVEVEHSRHQFISCPITKLVWKFINAIWMSLTEVIQSPFKWGFAQVELGGFSPSFSDYFGLFEVLWALVYLAYAKCFYI